MERDKFGYPIVSKHNARVLKFPHELPIYKLKGKYYYRDVRLREYRNIKDPFDSIPIDSVDNRDLETPTKEDSEKIWGKCDKNHQRIR